MSQYGTGAGGEERTDSRQRASFQFETSEMEEMFDQPRHLVLRHVRVTQVENLGLVFSQGDQMDL